MTLGLNYSLTRGGVKNRVVKNRQILVSMRNALELSFHFSNKFIWLTQVKDILISKIAVTQFQVSYEDSR